MEVVFTEGYLEQSRTSAMELFSLRLNHILKRTYRFQFLHNSTFREKACNCENLRKKSLLLTIENFFFEIRNYAMEWYDQ